MLEIFKSLSDVTIAYPTPNRVSLESTIDLIDKFSEEKSGGDIIETLVAALFKTVGSEFQLFDEIRRSKVNASDRSTGLTSDIECWLEERIVLGIEVKDKALNLTQFRSALESARANKITEILFIAEKGISKDDIVDIDQKLIQEFVSGQNVYIRDFISFATGVLILLGESGRVSFIRNIGSELERVNSKIAICKRWVELLGNV